MCPSKKFLWQGSTGITHFTYVVHTYLLLRRVQQYVGMAYTYVHMAGITCVTATWMDVCVCVCVCVLSRFLLHVVILEFLKLALFNDAVARVSRKHSHGVCMLLLCWYTCTHVTPYPSSPMLTVSPGISRKHLVQNRYLCTYIHTYRQGVSMGPWLKN